VLPGQYSVQLSKLINGSETQLGQSQSFEVAALGGESLNKQDPEAVLAFELKTGELLRRALGSQKVLSEVSERVRHVQKAVLDTPSASARWLEVARQLELELAELGAMLTGDPARRALSEPVFPGIITRLRQVANGHWRTTYGPTQTHRRNVEIASQEFEVFRARLKTLVEETLVSLERDLEAAGAPYTPGRPVP
jgi:hypothetical protein